MISPELYLATGIAGVFVASLLFTNAIERASDVMGWGHSFAGSIISPLFTSFPELMVFIISVFILGGASGQEIGVGTIVGEPFMASVFAIPMLFITIAASKKTDKKKAYIDVDRGLYVPFAFMSLLFPVLIVPAFFNLYFERASLAIFLVGAYLLYIFLMTKSRKNEQLDKEEGAESIYFSKFMGEKKAILAQSVASLLILLPSSSVLVSAVDSLSAVTGRNAFALAIIIVPIATLLPEMIASLIWAYRGKYTLSIGALIGEEVMYASIYPGISLLIIPWVSGTFLTFSIICSSIVSLGILLSILTGKIHKYAFISGLAFLVAYMMLIY